MSGDQLTRRGYLLLADISGYTAFLVGTELEHADAIVHELTALIRERLSPPMRFVKLEGDAVFCHADETTFEDGERLVELIADRGHEPAERPWVADRSSHRSSRPSSSPPPTRGRRSATAAGSMHPDA